MSNLEFKKAAEGAKKQQAASNSTGSDSSSSSSDSSTSTSTTASDWGQSTWTLTGRNGNGEVCNAPVEMYKAKAQGIGGSWVAKGDYCRRWHVFRFWIFSIPSAHISPENLHFGLIHHIYTNPSTKKELHAENQ